jgi:hypothetical protein
MTTTSNDSLYTLLNTLVEAYAQESNWRRNVPHVAFDFKGYGRRSTNTLPRCSRERSRHISPPARLRRRASTRRAAWLKFGAPGLSTPMVCSASTKMTPNGSRKTRLTAFGFGPAICRKRPEWRSKNARKENPSLATTVDAPEAEGLSAFNGDKSLNP